MRSRSLALLVTLVTLALLALLAPACRASSSRMPPALARAPGCDVTVFAENPSYQTDSVGAVRATCDTFVPDDECLRELKDQACKLGADTIWGIGNGPSREGGKTTYLGRAARRKGPHGR
jgi:hypothetical protein